MGKEIREDIESITREKVRSVVDPEKQVKKKEGKSLTDPQNDFFFFKFFIKEPNLGEQERGKGGENKKKNRV